MLLSKNDRAYSIVELRTFWRVSRNISSGLQVDYSIDKQICPTFADLESYIADNELF